MMYFMKNNNSKNRSFFWMMLRALILSLQLLKVLSWTTATVSTVSSASNRRGARRAPVSLLVLSASSSSATSRNETTNNGNNNGNTSSSSSSSKEGNITKGDNKAMAFLRKIGKVGGNTDFTHALGVDEGETGKAAGQKNVKLQKSANAYTPCTVSGIIDDVTQPFPLTSFGTSWSGFTDQAVFSTRGGKNSMATLSRRDDFHGRPANVLSGTVVRHAPYHKEGFIQMATNLANVLRQGQTATTTTTTTTILNSIDASAFQGIKLDVFYEHGISSISRNDDVNDDDDDDSYCDVPQSSFYVQFKTRDTSQEEATSSSSAAASSLSYRAKFPVTPCIQGKGGAWTTVQIPWKDFVPHVTSGLTRNTAAAAAAAATTTSPSTQPLPLDTTALVRMGIVVAINPDGENNNNSNDTTTSSSGNSNQENMMAISEKIVLGISAVEFYKD